MSADPTAALLHILIFYTDDLGIGDLGRFNPKSRIPTPNLGRLASQGLRFTDAHSISGICPPSRHALRRPIAPERISRYRWRPDLPGRAAQAAATAPRSRLRAGSQPGLMIIRGLGVAPVAGHPHPVILQLAPAALAFVLVPQLASNLPRYQQLRKWNSSIEFRRW